MMKLTNPYYVFWRDCPEKKCSEDYDMAQIHKLEIKLRQSRQNSI